MTIVEKTQIEPCKEHIIFSFDKDKVKTLVDDVAREIGKHNTIKGFMKGRASVEAVKSRAKQYVLEMARQKLTEEAYQDILFEQKWKPFGMPEILETHVSFNSFECKMIVGHLPTVEEVKQYKDLEIEEPDFSDIKPEEWEKSALDNLARQYATTEELAADQELSVGDIVIVDYVALMDNKPFEGSEGKGVVIEIGSKQFLHGFENNLIGAKKGERRVFAVPFPLDFRVEEMRGKVASFDVTIINGSKKIPHPINEEIAVQAGFMTLDEMKDTIKKNIQTSVDNTKNRRLQEVIVEKIIDSNQHIEIPQWIHVQMAKDLANNRKMDWEKLDDETRQKLMGMAKDSVLITVLLDKIRAQEVDSILSNEEVDRLLQEEFSKLNENYRQALLSDKTGKIVNKVREELQDKYFMDWLLNNNKVVKKEPEKKSEETSTTDK